MPHPHPMPKIPQGDRVVKGMNHEAEASEVLFSSFFIQQSSSFQTNLSVISKHIHQILQLNQDSLNRIKRKNGLNQNKRFNSHITFDCVFKKKKKMTLQSLTLLSKFPPSLLNIYKCFLLKWENRFIRIQQTAFPAKEKKKVLASERGFLRGL